MKPSCILTLDTSRHSCETCAMTHDRNPGYCEQCGEVDCNIANREPGDRRKCYWVMPVEERIRHEAN